MNRKKSISTIDSGFFIENVSFKYIKNSSSYVINNLSLTIPKGKITAIVGTSGSGKTTLIKLLLSFYSPQEGNIFLNGIPLLQINTNSLRNLCGVVMEDGRIVEEGTHQELTKSKGVHFNLVKNQLELGQS